MKNYFENSKNKIARTFYGNWTKKKENESLEVLKQHLTMAFFSWTAGKDGLIEKDVIK